MGTNTVSVGAETPRTLVLNVIITMVWVGLRMDLKTSAVNVGRDAKVKRTVVVVVLLVVKIRTTT